jgi:hypothetical protein
MYLCLQGILAFIANMEAGFVAKYSEKLAQNSHLALNNTCVLWHGAVKSQKIPPYGVINIKFEQVWKTISVHRLKYMLTHNIYPLEADINLDISHLCHNSLCINEHHLSMEPRYVNNNRIACKGNGACWGHEQYPECLLNLIL